MVYYILCGCIPVLLLLTDCNSIDLPGWETDLNWKCLASLCPPSWLRPIYSPHLTLLGRLPSPRPPTFFYKPLQSLFPKHQPFTSPSSGASVVHFLLHSFSFSTFNHLHPYHHFLQSPHMLCLMGPFLTSSPSPLAVSFLNLLTHAPSPSVPPSLPEWLSDGWAGTAGVGQAAHLHDSCAAV